MSELKRLQQRKPEPNVLRLLKFLNGVEISLREKGIRSYSLMIVLSLKFGQLLLLLLVATL